MGFRTAFLFFLTVTAGVCGTEDVRCAAPPGNYLSEKLAFWQPRLGLQDWKISLVMTPASGLKPKTLGNIRWDTDHKTAIIRVLDASDYQLTCSAMLRDMEVTVVHELVHLELSALPRSPATRGLEERAVNRITDALLALESAAPEYKLSSSTEADRLDRPK